MNILINIILLLNCFLISEEKSLSKLTKESNYLVSKKIKITDFDFKKDMVFIRGYDYIIIGENCDDTKPLIKIDNTTYSETKITPQVDCYMNISVTNTNFTTLIIGVKKNN